MTAIAEKTIDLQYYIWERDTTGRILALRLIEAADRGVRVRMLLDDHTLEGRDSRIAAMDAHPNIEIRIFNPFAHRGWRLFGFLTDFDRLNHRMHNKLVVMDNALAIVGGRNIGDHYFGVEPDTNFRDLDVAAAGPIVREVSKVFDHFWNGEQFVAQRSGTHTVPPGDSLLVYKPLILGERLPLLLGFTFQDCDASRPGSELDAIASIVDNLISV